ncbi:hypothetical protein [Xanthobacter autotrophicus]|uniref:hypothetical protein n=1 Tax=Xanthobacter autotrophicus TaxID=280 RepID=UPI00372C8BDC
MGKDRSIGAFDLVGAAAIAAFLGRSAWKVRDLHRQGFLPAVRLGKNGPLMARSSTLLRWIEEDEKKACAGTAP